MSETQEPRQTEGENVGLTAEKVKTALDLLDHYRRLGLEALERTEENANGYSEYVCEDLAQEWNETKVNVEKARRFASLYTQDDYDELCSLRLPNGLPIGWGHVSKLLSVRDADKRRELQRQAAENGWTARQLDDEIHELFPKKRSQAGRKPRAPQSVPQAVQQIVDRSQQWLRWYGVLQQANGENGRCPVSLSELPPNLRPLMSAAAEALETLQEAATEHIGSCG